MKSFIKAYKDYKSRPNPANAKLVWNPSTERWLVTSFFSVKYISFQGLEVVCHG